jgi:flagellar L-ring protein precursor FlgH
MRAIGPALTLAALAITSGCTSLEGALSEAETQATRAAAPRMTPSPSAAQMPMPEINNAAAGPSSLWRAGSRTFFADQRARRLGDILTVRIEIEDSAQLRNTTERERDGSISAGVDSVFGKENFLGRLAPPGGATPFNPANLIGANGQSQSSGTGTINRQETIDLTVAAVITEILPNGNFIVSGRQEVRINNELRELLVSGVIRPEDISPNNGIRHDQMAEARISYGGRGALSNVQRPPLGQRALEAFSPF